MGASESKASVHQELNQTVVNQSTINMVNTQLNNMVSSAIINDSKSCSAAINNNQSVKFVGLKATGDISIGVNQKQAAVLDFKCINVAKVRNDIANNMIQQMMGNLKSTTSVDVLNKLDALAKSKAETQFSPNPFAASSGDSKIEQIQNFKSATISNKNIENVIKNAIEAKFTSNTVQNCIAKVSNSQTVEVIDIVSGGKINAVIEQEQGVTLLTQCVNNTDVGNQLTSALAGYLDIKVKDDTSTSATSEFGATTESEAKNKGVFEGIGSMIESVGTAVGSIFGVAGLAPFLSPSSSICLFCCICLFILFAIFGSGMLSQNSDGAPEDMGMDMDME